MNARRTFHSFVSSALLMLGIVCAMTAEASVVITGTRVIYNAQDSEVTVKLSNVGSNPALVQAWIDKGEKNAAPSSINVPFTVTPPVSRIDPNKSQTLRLLYTGEPLPQDKESVFWLNVLEVPPKPSGDAAGANTMQLAFRSRIKLFFRPQGLAGNAQDAPAKITWRLVQSGSHSVLEATNPTPFHVSFAGLETTSGAKNVEGGMVAPGQTEQFPLDAPAKSGVVRYHAISDYGGAINGEAHF